MIEINGISLKDYLLERFPDAKLNGPETHIMMRCRFCGDSAKSPNARHLGINITGEIPFYNCFRCPASGVLTDEVLKKYFLNDNVNELDIRFLEGLGKIKKETSTRLSRMLNSDNVYPLKTTAMRVNDLSREKLNYVNQRLGLNLTFKDLVQNRICCNLDDFLDQNNLNPTCSMKQYTYFHHNCIGFISADRSTAIMRSINDKGNRYMDYKVFNDAKGFKFYAIPTSCDLFKPIELHVAEGVFDILSICYNLHHGDKYQKIYIAIGNKSYYNSILNILMRYAIPNFIVHIYPDSDVKQYELENLYDFLYGLYPTYIHFNRYPGEKDMGVPMNRIQEQVLSLDEL